MVSFNKINMFIFTNICIWNMPGWHNWLARETFILKQRVESQG